jgi:hypothetical protein
VPRSVRAAQDSPRRLRFRANVHAMPITTIAAMTMTMKMILATLPCPFGGLGRRGSGTATQSDAEADPGRSGHDEIQTEE